MLLVLERRGHRLGLHRRLHRLESVEPRDGRPVVGLLRRPVGGLGEPLSDGVIRERVVLDIAPDGRVVDAEP